MRGRRYVVGGKEKEEEEGVYEGSIWRYGWEGYMGTVREKYGKVFVQVHSSFQYHNS